MYSSSQPSAQICACFFLELDCGPPWPNRPVGRIKDESEPFDVEAEAESQHQVCQDHGSVLYSIQVFWRKCNEG